MNRQQATASFLLKNLPLALDADSLYGYDEQNGVGQRARASVNCQEV